MSRSYARNANTASLTTLCPICLYTFQDVKKAFLRRADVHQQTKDVCTYFQTRYGFDYYVQSAVHRATQHRKARTHAAESHIDPEFAGKIPPLREEELKQLEENILTDGVVINPLIVWNGVIVDGHNRYRILQQYPEIQFTTYEKQFLDRYAAIA